MTTRNTTFPAEERIDASIVRAALDEAGWKPARGQTLADGLTWLAQRSLDLADLEQEHARIRERLGDRVEQSHELRIKFRKQQKARLRLAHRLRNLEREHAELEQKYLEGWHAEWVRQQTTITDLEGTNLRYKQALQEIRDRPRGRSIRETFEDLEWCQNRARRALADWMPCKQCLTSHECAFAHDEMNGGRVEGYDCLASSEALFQS